MDKNETKKLIMAIVCCYPNWKPQVDMSFLIDTWTAMLKDVPYEQASQAVQRYVTTDTSGFAPSIGVIRDLVVKNATPDCEMSEMQAWAIVRKAISNSGYRYNSEFAKLPPVLQRAVGEPINLYHWSQMDSEVLGSVEQSHFFKAYRSAVVREREYQAIPDALKPLVALPPVEGQESFLIEQKDEEKELVSNRKLDEVKRKIDEMRRAIDSRSL